MTKPTFDFDVDYNFSLDTLKDELLDLVDVSKTKILFNICGPGGGNTNVLIYTEDSKDKSAIEAYMMVHGL